MGNPRRYVNNKGNQMGSWKETVAGTERGGRLEDIWNSYEEGCRANGETWLNGERGGGSKCHQPRWNSLSRWLRALLLWRWRWKTAVWYMAFLGRSVTNSIQPRVPWGGAAEMIVCRVTTLLWLCALYFQAPMHHSACTWVCILMPACMLCVSVVHCISNMYWAIRKRAAASHFSGGPSAASAATPRTF